jgi:uncharacterized protein involved in exopolysaccharide biosynthesis
LNSTRFTDKHGQRVEAGKTKKMTSHNLLTDFTRAALRQKLVILLSLLAFAAAAFFAVRRLPPVYESSATLAVNPASSESLRDRAPSNQSNQLAALQQQAASRPLLESIIARLQPLNADQTNATLDDIISEMRAAVIISAGANPEGESQSFVISYRATDAEAAQKITNEIASAIIAESEKVAPGDATAESEVLRERALQLVAQLNELERKAPWLVTLDEYTPAVAPATRVHQPSAETARAEQMNIESLRDQQYKIQQQLADVERRLNVQKQIVEQQKKGGGLRNNPTYAALIARRAELEGQRDTLINRQELTDKHPRVVGILDQINAINRQIDELRQQDANNISQTAEARELAALESERNRLKIDLEITDREIARRTSVTTAQERQKPAPSTTTPSRRDPRTAQEYIALKKSYDDCMKKLESAESKQQSNAAKLGRLQLSQAASLPERPVSPDRLLLICVAAAAGLALGVVLAVVIESRRRNSLQTARDVERYARLPLLVAIPKTTTEAERRLLNRQARMRYAISTTVAAIGTFALTQIFIITEVFSLIAKK